MRQFIEKRLCLAACGDVVGPPRIFAVRILSGQLEDAFDAGERAGEVATAARESASRDMWRLRVWIQRGRSGIEHVGRSDVAQRLLGAAQEHGAVVLHEVVGSRSVGAAQLLSSLARAPAQEQHAAKPQSRLEMVWRLRERAPEERLGLAKLRLLRLDGQLIPGRKIDRTGHRLYRRPRERLVLRPAQEEERRVFGKQAKRAAQVVKAFVKARGLHPTGGGVVPEQDHRVAGRPDDIEEGARDVPVDRTEIGRRVAAVLNPDGHPPDRSIWRPVLAVEHHGSRGHGHVGVQHGGTPKDVIQLSARGGSRHDVVQLQQLVVEQQERLSEQTVALLRDARGRAGQEPHALDLAGCEPDLLRDLLARPAKIEEIDPEIAHQLRQRDSVHR